MNSNPTMSCGFRPFFLVTASYGVLMLVWWAALWAGYLPAPATVGGPIVWHAYELIYGFAFAAIIGFLTTALSEFVTDVKVITPVQMQQLLVVWGLGRVLFWCSGWLSIWPAMVVNLLLPLLLIRLLAPPIWRDPGRPQRSFLYALGLLWSIEVGFYWGGIQGENVMPWLYLGVSAMMILIIVALSRISMRLINDELDAREEETTAYLARPPRRNMAIFTIALYSGMAFFIPANPITGWLALAAGAAMLNLLNDWHVGRVLFVRWVFPFYLVYWFIALGYLLIGVSILSGWGFISSGHHFLTAGGIGLTVMMVMMIVGLAHTGRRLVFHGGHITLMGLIIVATLLRVVAPMGWFAPYQVTWWIIAAVLWGCAYLGWLWLYARYMVSPRPDGEWGC